jgi:hypothetical protein
MPALNLDLDYFDHPKTKRLVGLLGRGAEVLPIKLWAFCGKFHAESGRLTGYAAQEIESIVGWWGRPGDLMAALVRVGFVRQEGEEVFVVHEWAEHEGHIAAFKVRAKRAAGARWSKLAGSDPDATSNATSIAKEDGKQCPIPTKPTNQSPQPPEGGGKAPRAGEEPPAEIPRSLDTAPFRAAWREWMDFRSRSKKRLSSIAQRKQLKFLEGLGPLAACASIEASIRNDWQGLFEPKVATGPPRPSAAYAGNLTIRT